MSPAFACAAVLWLLAAPAAADDTVVWHTHAALRNDALTDLDPPVDDLGFTHDNVFSLRRMRGDTAFGGGVLQRWITSRVDRRRWDQLDLVALGERTWPHRIVTAVRLGPTLGGNFGGRYLQNGWHDVTGTGPTLEQGLANDYAGDRSIGVLAGVRGRAQLGDDLVHGYVVLDGQVGLGAGVTSCESVIGGSAGARHVGVQGELALTRYHASDPNLALAGGYGTGWQLEWRLGVYVAWSRYRVSYQYRANEGGSGEPIGVVAFQSRT